MRVGRLLNCNGHESAAAPYHGATLTHQGSGFSLYSGEFLRDTKARPIRRFRAVAMLLAGLAQEGIHTDTTRADRGIGTRECFHCFVCIPLSPVGKCWMVTTSVKVGLQAMPQEGTMAVAKWHYPRPGNCGRMRSIQPKAMTTFDKSRKDFAPYGFTCVR